MNPLPTVFPLSRKILFWAFLLIFAILPIEQTLSQNQFPPNPQSKNQNANTDPRLAKISSSLQSIRQVKYVQKFEQKLLGNSRGTWKFESKMHFQFTGKNQSQLKSAHVIRSKPNPFERFIGNEKIYQIDHQKKTITVTSSPTVVQKFGLLNLYGSIAELKLVFPKVLSDPDLTVKVEESNSAERPSTTVKMIGPKRIERGALVTTREKEEWTHLFEFDSKTLQPISWKAKFPKGTQTTTYHQFDTNPKSLPALPENWQKQFHIVSSRNNLESETKRLAKHIGKNLSIQNTKNNTNSKMTVVAFLFPGCSGVKILPELQVKLSSLDIKPRYVVLDPFSGSGGSLKTFLAEEKVKNHECFGGKNEAKKLEIGISPTFLLLDQKMNIVAIEPVKWKAIIKAAQKIKTSQRTIAD